MIVYISGKITGSNNYERQFANAEEFLTKKGFKVINPVTVINAVKDILTYEQILSIDIQLVAMSDCIFMLNGWQSSKGAETELQVAKNLRKKILYQNYFGRLKKESETRNSN